ncbi:hypothetical protein niasHT_038957 [Heterodera trifolii]|uniref:G-protein coupled receptors family 1 profile domain-containing protein n=1 Tax=Heterodera trifolii TaxID=157864 RepID=A0ABD2I492_9BILA
MLSIGIDRLFSVVTPFWIGTVNPKVYLSILICACFAYAFYAISLLSSANLLQNPNRMVPCSLGDFYIGTIGQQLFYNAMIFTGLSLLCYVSIWLVFQIRKFSHTDPKPEVDYTRRLFASLASIVSLVFFGYFLNSLSLLLLPSFGFSNVQNVFVSYALHLVTDLTGTINAPLLYLLSTEYRNAFDELFGRALFVWRRNAIQNTRTAAGNQRMNIVRANNNNQNNNLTWISLPNPNSQTCNNNTNNTNNSNYIISNLNNNNGNGRPMEIGTILT